MGNYDMKRLFLITGLTALCATASAQESADTTIERNVDVVKEYNPIIKDAGKISMIFTTSPEDAKKYVAMGFDAVTNGLDADLFFRVYKEMTAAIRG